MHHQCCLLSQCGRWWAKNVRSTYQLRSIALALPFVSCIIGLGPKFTGDVQKINNSAVVQHIFTSVVNKRLCVLRYISCSEVHSPAQVPTALSSFLCCIVCGHYQWVHFVAWVFQSHKQSGTYCCLKISAFHTQDHELHTFWTFEYCLVYAHTHQHVWYIHHVWFESTQHLSSDAELMLQERLMAAIIFQCSGWVRIWCVTQLMQINKQLNIISYEGTFCIGNSYS